MITANNLPDWSSVYPALFGSFCFSGTSLPYATIMMPTSEACAQLRRANEIVLDRAEVNLSELFQRQIDKNRVSDEIIPYLRSEGELVFFSSLVCVLVPPLHLDSSYLPAEALDIARDPKLLCGTIRWNRDFLGPVVIDGQHRLSALRGMAGLQDSLTQKRLTNSSISILLILAAEALGYKAPKNVSILGCARKIFVDLNKHAIPVTEARNILLDDVNLQSLCTRGLFGHSTSETRSLPLGLVNWYSEQPKIDQGVHLTSVLILNSAVGEHLRLPAVNSNDQGSSHKLHDRMLEICNQLEAKNLVPLLNLAREESDANETPLRLGRTFNVALANKYCDKWRGPIMAYLLSIAPYADLYETLKSHGMISGIHRCWLVQDEDGKNAYLGEFPESRANIESLCEAVAQIKRDCLFYQVVFQKALLKLLFLLHGAREAIDYKKGHNDLEFAISLGNDVNEFLGSAHSERTFWEGTAVKPSGRLSWTQTSVNRICSQLAVSLVYLSGQLALGSQDPSALVLTLRELASKRTLSPSQKFLKEQFRHWREGIKQFLKEKNKTQTGTSYVSSDEIDKHIIDRMRPKAQHYA